MTKAKTRAMHPAPKHRQRNHKEVNIFDKPRRDYSKRKLDPKAFDDRIVGMLLEPTDNTIVWTTELRRLGELKPYEYNPRVMTRDQAKLLTNSLRDTGYAELIAVNTDNTIIAGHQRHTILLEQYSAEHVIEVRVPSRPLTNEEFKRYLISSNKATGEWDYDILANSFDVDALLDLGFSLKEFEIEVDGDQVDRPAGYRITIDIGENDNKQSIESVLNANYITYSIKERKDGKRKANK